MADNSQQKVRILKIEDASSFEADDQLAVEEPLEIRLNYGTLVSRQQKSISVTMRTPGHDDDLARGFLLSEGIINHFNENTNIHLHRASSEHIITVELHPDIVPDMQKLQRNFYTSSSCGVCGKTSIEAVHQACKLLPVKDTIKIAAPTFLTLTDKLRQAQAIFKHTGGLHACALFDLDGNLLLVREDVGRHNAFDKLIGCAMLQLPLPLTNYIVLLSGRASFELIQKAMMAGVKVIAAVGAPSSLAVALADDSDITLIGFLKNNRFNIYTGTQRIINLKHENTH